MKSRFRSAALLTSVLALLGSATVSFGARAGAAPLAPRAEDANITRLTAGVLEHSQFSHHPLDSKLASAFLDGYLDSLDAMRSVFLQSDVDEFAAYRATLAQATRETGDTAAARVIFARYIQRLEQEVAYFNDTLRSAKFDFTGQDTYSFDREQARRPSDLAHAQELWRQQLRVEYLQEKLSGKQPEQIVNTLIRRHTQQLKTLKAFRSDEVLEVYLNALAHVYDPHSDYLGHEQMESLSIAMNLSLFGIGASLQTEDGYCKIHELIPGGPAAKSGLLKPGDRIIAVAQGDKEPVDIVNMPLSRAVELIRGPKGSTVKLTILPAGESDAALPRTAALVRAEIKLEDQAAKARIVDLPADGAAALRLGVVDLPSFYVDAGHNQTKGRSATADVARLLRKLKAEHVQGVVLDLRHNGGGSLAEAISLTGLFIRTGPVVQIRDQSGHLDVGQDDDAGVAYDGPLIVLTSRFSASASEILAGALQDYARALVVGDSSTFGKGTVQTILPLADVMARAGLEHAYDPGALKITTNKFYRPSGASTQLRGVASDIVLPSTSDFSDVNESALKNPLPWDVVLPAPYKRLDRVQPYLQALREKSAQRVASDKAFSELAVDIARLKEKVAAKSVSLNEPKRREELANDKARREERARAERALRTAQPTAYEITLANASAPGLPPPMVAKPPKRKDTTPAGDSAQPDADDVSADQSRADTTIVNESLRILADYVDMLHRAEHANQPRAADDKVVGG
jgi:carboxyl-terminal processing protease